MKKGKYLFAMMVIGLAFFVAGCQSGTGERTESSEAPAIDYSMDLGGEPWVFDIEEATLGNESYRVANWTGKNMQLVFMTLQPGEIIDLEMHSGHDQFIRIEQGEARVQMGKAEDNLNFDKKVSDDWAILVPAGYWHKVENIGRTDLKVYTLYGPPEHKKGTAHKTYEEAREAHHDH
ncbi:MAG: cupin domain-containing protein [Mariniphaga sp.]|nr:cupin domain-containing protein [Mariniphaga sp.]MDD4424985.1 cupin domain-containing protein [Mariniphaga sp.]